MMDSMLEFSPQGDRGLLVYLGDRIDGRIGAGVRGLAAALKWDKPAWVFEVIPAYTCLQVEFDPLAADHAGVEAWVRDQARGLKSKPDETGRVVEVPVVYGGDAGPDLAEMADLTGLGMEEIVRRHTKGGYTCYMVGFTPGFPYLGGLDPKLAAPRMDTPRLDLPWGVVGIAGNQTGLYPTGGPGGWRIIGRTPELIYDPRRAEPALIHAGDLVKFKQIESAEFPEPVSPARAGEFEEPLFEVLAEGAMSSIQDQGRRGWQDIGVPVSGALDQLGLRLANHLVGGPADAAGLEITLMGPKLKVLSPARIAVCGADLGLRINSRPARHWRCQELKTGDIISFTGPKDGARAVMALDGGFAAVKVMGSRSVYPMGLIGGPLKKGDMLARQGRPADAPPLSLNREIVPRPARSLTLRVTPGPNRSCFTADGLKALVAGEYVVTAQSDRRGIRLSGPKVELDPNGPGSIISEPNLPGVIQVPGSGEPIILLREQTVGGYAKCAVIISADLDALALALPGDRLRFTMVSHEEAVQAARDRERLAGILCKEARP